MIEWLTDHGLSRDKAEALVDALAALGVTPRGLERLEAILKNPGGDHAPGL